MKRISVSVIHQQCQKLTWGKAMLIALVHPLKFIKYFALCIPKGEGTISFVPSCQNWRWIIKFSTQFTNKHLVFLVYKQWLRKGWSILKFSHRTSTWQQDPPRTEDILYTCPVNQNKHLVFLVYKQWLRKGWSILKFSHHTSTWQQDPPRTEDIL